MFRNVRKELITIPAQMSYLSQVRDFIEHIGRKYRYTDKVTNSFKLVIEEACTNIIRHGYRDIKGGEITLKAIIRRQSLTIVIVDQGISYDPRQATTPDLQKYIQIGKKGGLGIFMMRKLMDDVQYNITSRGNELRLTKQREFIPQTPVQGWWENLTMRTRHTIKASVAVTAMAFLVFTLLYSGVEDNVLRNAVEFTRGQAYSLSSNSRELLLDEKYLDLFSLAKSYKTSNKEIISETFIVDSSNSIVSSSDPYKAIGQYEVPEDAKAIEDSLSYFSIYRYTRDDTLDIYDFRAGIYDGLTATERGSGNLIGWAHLWVPHKFIVDRANSSKNKIILMISIILLAAYALSYFLIDRIVSPFHSLADWVRQVGQGTVDEDEIDIDASDELGEIAQAFNMMTNKFREAQVNLIEQQRLQKELQVAQEIQQMLLPSDFPQVRGYELASFYEAAKEVGGDLFDFVEVDSDTIGICVADVAGKGVPGSLIMTMIRTALRLEARGNKNPAEVLSRVNRFVTDDMKRGMFVTMFYMILDSRNRIIHYASAGHNPMILYRGSTKQTYYLNPSGFPVGIQLPDISLFDRKIESDSIRLRPDDLLVLYTDGVTEAMNQKRELYREERFLDAIRKNSHYDVSDFITRVKDDIKSHTQGYPQNDDITYVAVKEKLMQGEVIYSVHKELFRMIEEEGIMVKDACEKMQVSPYMYRKYKKIIEDVGWEGLKDNLYETDYIERKHTSIEVKTKLLDIVKNNPEYGAKRISDELNSEKYGFTKLDPRRVYEELKRAKLNTKEKREALIHRGDRKRIKLPGTPLLTLDGEVILDYESAEQVIAKRRGVEVPDQLKPKEVKTESRESRTISTPKVEKAAAEQATPERIEEEEEKTPAKAVSQKPPASKVIVDEEETIELDGEEAHEEVSFEEPAEAQEEKDRRQKIPDAPEEGEQVTSEEKEVKPVRAEPPRLVVPEMKIDKATAATFYKTAADDMKLITETVNEWSDDSIKREDLDKIVLSLTIMITHPLLKKLGHMHQLFVQVKKGIAQLAENADGHKPHYVMESAKDLLKYIEKENILNNSDLLLEQINQIGVRINELKREKSGPKSQRSQLDSIRKKISQKNLIKNVALLENITKTNRG